MQDASARRARLLAVAFALSLAAFVLALASGARAGTIVADTGFRPDPSGFSFENYGDEVPYQNLDAAQMQRLFGSSVCLTGRGAKCVLTPPARNWMRSQNEGMAGGHCYGFAALTEAINKGLLPRFGVSSLAAFGPSPTPFGLSIEGNTLLQRSIARAFVFQTLPAVLEKRMLAAPNQILDVLRRDLNPSNPEAYTMLIFQRGYEGGHAITPYAVEDMGGGIFQVHVYDNNWPGDANRRLTIDTNRNTWSYYAATNPGVPAAEYEGDASSKTLGLDKLRPGLGTQPCFFCIGRQGAKSRYNEIRLDGAATDVAHLLITDTKGRKTGYVGDRFVNRIPGVRVVPRTSGGPTPTADGGAEYPSTLEPIYKVPKNVRFKLRIDGRQMSVSDVESLSLVGPTYDATIENIRMGPGQVAHVWLSPKGNALTYRASRRTKMPLVAFGAQSKRTAYSISAAQVGAPPRTKFKFVKSDRYKLMYLGDESTKKRRYVISIDRYSRQGKDTLAQAFTIKGKQMGFLYYGPLAKPNGVPRIVIYNPGREKIRTIPFQEVPQQA